jgi:NCAIR mutase (PurE)-related protein
MATEAAQPDFARHLRKGVPEVIFADSKTVEQSLDIARRFLDTVGRAILSRVPPQLEARLRTDFEDEATVEWIPAPRAAVLRRAGFNPPQTGGRVGVITAGTSDIPWAEEAALLCREMGCSVVTAYDVGVAGIHRLWEPLHSLLDEANVDVLIVAAGMDGALLAFPHRLGMVWEVEVRLPFYPCSRRVRLAWPSSTLTMALELAPSLA